MKIEIEGFPLAGYKDYDTLMITYSFDSGKQQVLYCYMTYIRMSYLFILTKIRWLAFVLIDISTLF